MDCSLQDAIFSSTHAHRYRQYCVAELIGQDMDMVIWALPIEYEMSNKDDEDLEVVFRNLFSLAKQPHVLVVDPFKWSPRENASQPRDEPKPPPMETASMSYYSEAGFSIASEV